MGKSSYFKITDEEHTENMYIWIHDGAERRFHCFGNHNPPSEQGYLVFSLVMKFVLSTELMSCLLIQDDWIHDLLPKWKCKITTISKKEFDTNCTNFTNPIAWVNHINKYGSTRWSTIPGNQQLSESPYKKYVWNPKTKTFVTSNLLQKAK